jgi:hypothetical protein
MFLLKNPIPNSPLTTKWANIFGQTLQHWRETITGHWPKLWKDEH